MNDYISRNNYYFHCFWPKRDNLSEHPTIFLLSFLHNTLKLRQMSEKKNIVNNLSKATIPNNSGREVLSEKTFSLETAGTPLCHIL